MKKLLLIALSAILLGTTHASAKFITNPLEGTAMQTSYTFYKVSRNARFPINSFHADRINAVLSVYGTYALLTTDPCRTWWLNEPVVAGDATKWSYYFFSDGTVPSSTPLLSLSCPLGPL